jgi:hypothetical protein
MAGILRLFACQVPIRVIMLILNLKLSMAFSFHVYICSLVFIVVIFSS